MPNDQAQHEPRLTGWGRDESNQLLHFEVTGFGERVCVVRTKDGWKAGTWRTPEEIAARQADAQASPPASEGVTFTYHNDPHYTGYKCDHPGEMSGQYVPLARYDAQAARLAEVEAELAKVQSELTALRSALLEKAAEWRWLADGPPEKIGPAGPRQMLRRSARELESLAKEPSQP